MTLNEAAEIGAALGNSGRLKILQLLLQSGPRGLIVGRVQDLVGMPGPTLSHHLDRLKEIGLVTVRRQGTFLWYQPVPDRLRDFADWLVGLSATPVPTEEEVSPEEVPEVQIEAD